MTDQQAFKFKKLVEVCLETKNYRKLGVITLAMIKNEVVSHLITLNISLNFDSPIYEIMIQVNNILRLKFGITLYKESLINQIKLTEKLMERGKGKIPLRFIKEAISIYFDLQQISLLPFTSVTESSPVKFSKSFFSRFNQSYPESIIQQLIKDELNSRESMLRTRIESGRDEDVLSELHKISCLKESLIRDKNRKIQLNDSASRDQRYFLFFVLSKTYPLLGVFFLLAFLSLLVLFQIILNLELLMSLGSFLLMFASGSAFSLYLYGIVKKKVVNTQW